MKKIILILSILLIFPKPIYAQSTFTVNQPDSSAFFGSFQGFGAEWDPFFFNEFGQQQGLNETDWNIITNRIKEMDVPITRMWIQLFWSLVRVDPTAVDPFTWDRENARMQSVYRYLDFACQNDIDVILTDWGWSFWYSYGLFNKNLTDPNYAKALSLMVKDLKVTRGYDCIKYFIEGNEPDYEMVGQDGITYADYIKLYQNIHQAFIETGIRQQIKLLAPDPASCCKGMFLNTLPSLHPVLDGYDFHLYPDQNTTQNTPGYIREQLDLRRSWLTDEIFPQNPEAYSKPLFVTEAGMADVSKNNTWEYALDMADFGTSALLSRVQGVIAWNMHDIYYEQGHYSTPFENNQRQYWGMWDYKDTGWKLRPWAQTWGLLVKFTPRNSLQAKVNNTSPQSATGNIRVGAIKKPDGTWSLFLVNRNTTTQAVQISLPDTATHTFMTYRADSTTLSSYPDRIIPPASGTLTTANTIQISLPSKSFTVLSETVSTLKLGDVDRDGDVDIDDYNKLVIDFGKTSLTADFNGNGTVDIFDYNILVTNFGQ